MLIYGEKLGIIHKSQGSIQKKAAAKRFFAAADFIIDQI